MKQTRKMFAALFACVAMMATAFATTAPPPTASPSAIAATPIASASHASRVTLAPSHQLVAAAPAAHELALQAQSHVLVKSALVGLAPSKASSSFLATGHSAPPDPSPGHTQSELTMISTSSTSATIGLGTSPSSHDPVDPGRMRQANFVDTLLASFVAGAPARLV